MRGREGDRWCSVVVNTEGEGGARPLADTRLVRVQVCPYITLKHYSLLLIITAFVRKKIDKGVKIGHITCSVEYDRNLLVLTGDYFSLQLLYMK